MLQGMHGGPYSPMVGIPGGQMMGMDPSKGPMSHNNMVMKQMTDAEIMREK